MCCRETERLQIQQQRQEGVTKSRMARDLGLSRSTLHSMLTRTRRHAKQGEAGN